jgi:hypothetical protein
VLLTPPRVAILATIVGFLTPSPLPAATTPSLSAVAQATPSPKPSVKPLTISGFARSYYFTRQNASDNPGVQSVFQGSSSKPTYNANAVNQASWNTGLDLHGEYRFNDGLYAGATYLYASPMDGACVVPDNHTVPGAAASNVVPACNRQLPQATNPDDTLPGFRLSTFYEAYVGFKSERFSAKVGDQLFTSPWANPADGRIKPAAYQGADLSYAVAPNWTVEAADIIQYENRTSSTFSNSTLLTSYSAGAAGPPSNLATPKCFASGCTGFNTAGFLYGKVGYAGASGFSADGYFYGISDLTNILWFDGTYQVPNLAWGPFIAVQGGTNNNAGASYLGKVDSQAFGVQIGAKPTRNVLLTLGMDTIPWKHDTIVLPKGVSCSSSGPTPTYQIKTASGSSLQYFLPTNAAQCSNNADGTATIYYGGWASPYTDSYAMADPLYTSGLSQGMIERRSGGTSLKAVATYTSSNKRLLFIASDAWFNYGNAIAPNYTNEWDLDGSYRFSAYSGSGPYRGFMVRDRYMNRTDANTYYPQGTTASCQPLTPCSQLGGIPLFKYNRVMLEYDF